MIIKKIQLKNFRQYIDTTIDFATDPEKNITIIMGDNGTGKTTLAQAFQWVLYGTTDFQVKELLNRRVREQMTPNYPDNEKTVSVTLDVIYNSTLYTLKRSQTYRKNGLKPEIVGTAKFTISYINNDNGNSVIVPEHQQEYLVRNLLPKDLSKFFFFDGERIEEMANLIQEGKGSTFKDAVYGLVGLSAIQNSIEHLYSSKTNRAGSSVIKVLQDEYEANSKSIEQLTKYNKDIESFDSQLEGLYEEKSELENEIEKIEQQIEHNSKIILQETPKIELKNQYEKLVSELATLKRNRISAIKNDYLKQFQTGFYGFCTLPLANDKKVQELLKASAPEDKVIPGLTKKTIDHLLEREICLCGSCIKKDSDGYNAVRNLLEFSYPKTIGSLKEDFMKTSRSVEREANNFFDSLTVSMQQLADFDARIEAKEQEIGEKMNMLANTDKGEEAKKQNETFRNLRKSKQDKLVSLCSTIQIFEQKKHRLEEEKAKLVIVDSASQKAQRYLAYAKVIYEKMKDSYGKKETLYRNRLQKGMNEIFEQIYDGNIRISIDDKYRIFVNVIEEFSSGDEVEKNTAQSYALIFAFIAAVIDLAKKKINESATDESEKIDVDKEGFPLVMDAPLSAFDTTRIKSICTEIPRIADQVIMFIKDTDGNVAEEYMKEKIGAKYLAHKVNDSNLHTDVEKED